MGNRTGMTPRREFVRNWITTALVCGFIASMLALGLAYSIDHATNHHRQEIAERFK